MKFALNLFTPNIHNNICTKFGLNKISIKLVAIAILHEMYFNQTCIYLHKSFASNIA